MPNRLSIKNHSACNLALTPTIKSYGSSLFLHAAVIAALYAIPASSIRRFASPGQARVISIQASQFDPAVTLVSVTAEPLSITSQLDSLVDRMVKSEDLEPKVVDVESRPKRSDLPRVPAPPGVREVPIEFPLQLKRRKFDPPSPEVTVADEIERQHDRHILSEPPVPSSIPIEQFVGIEERSSADLSNNRPPAYPVEAIRRKLEGTVLLRLQIAKSGKVSNVELIRSSGHAVLDNAAVAAVASWEGTPARSWGQAVDSVERLPIRFRL